MTRVLVSLLLLIVSVLITNSTRAETLYVTDQYDFNLRAGQSNRYKIIRTLPSGTPLQVIDTNTKSGYAHVRTEDGRTGYILTRYLQQEPAARQRLAEMSARLEELQQAPDQLAAKLSRVQQQNATLQTEYKTLERAKQKLEQELAEVRYASANAVRINQERQQLREQNAGLRERIGDLEQKTRELGNLKDQRWFLIGAAVVSGGMLIGLILPNVRLRRQRRSWSSL